MRNISNDLQSHLEGQITTIAMCVRIERTDGQVFAFTSHDVDISYNGDTYKASHSGTASNLKSSGDLSVDNIDAEMILDDESITMKDLRAGLFDFATVRVFLLNYKDTSQGELSGLRGILGEVSIEDFTAKVEFRSLSQYLQQEVGRVYNYLCDVDELGDSRCGVDTSPFTFSGEIASVTDRQTFTITGAASGKAADYYKYGVISWHGSGAASGELNAGLSMEVREHDDSNGIILFQKMPYTINVGDPFVIVAGCDREFTTCKDTFSNGVNFRGFPHIPGRDEISKGSN